MIQICRCVKISSESAHFSVPVISPLSSIEIYKRNIISTELVDILHHALPTSVLGHELSEVLALKRLAFPFRATIGR
jgi:hypothetical protein